MDSSFFCQIRDLWSVSMNRDRWIGSHIRGGVRTGCHYNFFDLDPIRCADNRFWVPVTESQSYKNKIRCSNSIFKFEKISLEKANELGLVDYPEIWGYDAPAILSNDFAVPYHADDLFRKFNAGIAPGRQMRLFILLFDWQRGIGISELQRAFWQGGNKNEFVICIGVDASMDVHWAKAFSWSDEQQVEVEVAQELMNRKHLDWEHLYHWLENNVSRWKRKEFKDFNYIHVSLPLQYLLGTLFLSLLENALLLWIFIK